MVGSAKKTMQFGIFVFVAVQETNWRGNKQGSKCDGDFIFLWKLFSFYEKVPSYFDLVGFFLKYFYPNLRCDVFNWSSVFNYAVRKNIFACLFSVHNTRRLSSHEQVRLIIFRDTSPIIYQKRLQICYKKRSKKISWSCQKNRTSSAKRLSQPPFFRFWLRARSLLIVFFTKIEHHNSVLGTWYFSQ